MNPYALYWDPMPRAVSLHEEVRTCSRCLCLPASVPGCEDCAGLARAVDGMVALLKEPIMFTPKTMRLLNKPLFPGLHKK